MNSHPLLNFTNVSMRKTLSRLLLFSACVFSVVHAQDVYLITATDDAYTTDGTNSWNALGLSLLDVVSGTTNLVDTSGSSGAGLVWTVTDRGRNSLISDTASTWPTLPWFDDTEAPQTDFWQIQSGNNNGGEFTISGFDPTDVINIQWIASHNQSSNTRELDLTINGAFSNVISGSAVSSDDFLTNAPNTTYMEWSGLTPDGAGNLVINWDQGTNTNAFFPVLTAARIEVVPEPSTLVLLGISFASLLVFRRRRG